MRRMRLLFVMCFVASLLGCDGSPTRVGQAIGFGSQISGTVTVNGVGVAGVELALMVDAPAERVELYDAAVTGAGGGYAFSDVRSDFFVLSVRTRIVEECEPQQAKAQIDFGEHQVFDFVCVSRSGLYKGLMRVSGGDESHDPFVFNTGLNRRVGRELTFTIAPGGGRVIVEAPAFGPSPLPVLPGTIDSKGNFELSGRGPMAGQGSVTVSASGRINLNGSLKMEITVGGNGELSKGTPIVYSFSHTRDGQPIDIS